MMLELCLIRVPNDNPAGRKAAPRERLVAVIAVGHDKITLPVPNEEWWESFQGS